MRELQDGEIFPSPEILNLQTAERMAAELHKVIRRLRQLTDGDTKAVWLRSGDLSRLAAVTTRSARKALKKGEWRSASLAVREISGRGGRAGKQYLVRLDSLPIELQEHWKALRTPFEAATDAS